MNESIVQKFNYSDSYVLTPTLIYKYEYNEYEYNADIKLIPFEVCLIHKPTHSDSQIKKNTSSDLNHSSKFIVLVVVVFTKKEEKKRQREQAKQTHNLPLSIAVFVSESYLFCDSCKC